MGTLEDWRFGIDILAFRSDPLDMSFDEMLILLCNSVDISLGSDIASSSSFLVDFDQTLKEIYCRDLECGRSRKRLAWGEPGAEFLGPSLR